LATIAGVALVGSTLLKIFVFQAYYVPSGSMQNTLNISDRFVVSRLSQEINRGDIVVFYDAAGWMAETEYQQQLRKSAATRFLKMNGIIPSRDNDVMVKRVIGLPGDTVACCNAFQQVQVNGIGIDEPYLSEGMYPSLIKFSVEVPAGSLFIMGDNRAHSADSRRFLEHESGGFISVDDVIGRATATIWPPANMTWHNQSPSQIMEAGAPSN
jgi:signal peptidase I